MVDIIHNAAFEAAPAGQSVANSAGRDRIGDRALRVWLLTNAPSPYQAELLSAIADRDDLELEVRFLQAGSPAGRSSEHRYSSRVMCSITPDLFPEELQFHPRAVWECLTCERDCFVLSGLYTSITFLACALVLTLRRQSWVVWFERPRPDRPTRANWSPRGILSRPVRWLRDAIRMAVLNWAHRVICIGTAARDAYRSRGVAGHRLDVLPYCCDIDRFVSVDPSLILKAKERYAQSARTVFLFSGQLIERKGVDVAIAAFARISSESPDAALLLIGDGPCRAEYEASVPEELRARVRFAGHIPQEELPAIFRAADVFVFPSRHDGWGVVINEACAAALPVITTHQAGAARDLVEQGRSGFVLECDDVAGFAAAMRRLNDCPDERAAYGRRSRELVERFSPARGAERFQRAIAAACSP